MGSQSPGFMQMDASQIKAFVDAKWDAEIVPQLVEYIRIPNKSPMFDADWAKHGHMEAAAQLLAGWAKQQPLKGMTVEIVRLEGRTPVLHKVPLLGWLFRNDLTNNQNNELLIFITPRILKS